MNSKYKMMKFHGFNPFRSHQSRQLSESVSKDNVESQKIKALSKLNMKEIALILKSSQQIDNDKKQLKDQQCQSLVTQNYELHKFSESQGEKARKSILMFNEKEFCKKTFDQVFSSETVNKKFNEFHESIMALEKQKESKQNSRLIIYLANCRQQSQKVILGHNQNLSDSVAKTESSCLLQAIFQKMLSEKTESSEQKPSSIYFSAIGIEKQNSLFDLLNEQNIHNDSSLSGGKVAQVKIRKILRQYDSIIAENLKKQPIKDKNHLNELIEKTRQVKNFIEFYDNFNQSFFLGELYHFYEANSDYDLFNECIVLKINQHFPKLSVQTLGQGFYERRLMESNSSRIATLMMRIGLNIKACKKNKLQKQASIRLPKKMSQVQMHQSKILLYLGPIFMNLNTHYVLVNQVGSGATMSDEIKKFELNRGFRPDNNIGNLKLASFYHTKHYLDINQVQQIVHKLAIKYVSRRVQYQKTNSAQYQKTKYSLSINNEKINNVNSRASQNSGRIRQHDQIKVNKQQSQEYQKEQEKMMQSMKYKKYSQAQTNRTYQTDTKRRKSMLNQGQRVKSKSFFCHTISSSQRNYWKSIDRRQKKMTQPLVDIGKLLYTTGNEEELNNNCTVDMNVKTINSKAEGLGFVDEKSLVKKSLEGVRVTYKRKLVVKALSKAQTACNI